MKRKKIWIGLGSVVGVTFLLKLLFLMLPAVVMPPAAQAQFSTTTNYGMKKPNSGLTTGWDVYLNGNFDLLDGILGGMNTLTQNSTTPSVTVSSTYPINWKTNNTSTTAITNFTNGAAGQRITILCTDSNTSFASGGTLSVVAPFLCQSGFAISFVLNGTVWTETGRTPGTVADDLGSLTYNASGTTTFAAGGYVDANAKVTTTASTSTTLSPTGLAKWGSYVLEITNASGTAATVTLGTAGTCSAWKVGGGGAGAITLSGASAIDVLAFTYDGTNCIANFRTNFN